MRQPIRRVTILAALFLLVGPAACSCAPPPGQPPVSADGVEVKKVLVEVQKALKASAGKLSTQMPDLESVTLTLQASVTKDVGGKISLFFISFGHSVQREATQELTLTLTPPKIERAIAPPPPTLADQLVDAIVGAVNGVQDARQGDPPLQLKTLEVVVSFVVERDTSGKAEFTIQPVTFNLGGDLKDKAVQRLRLLFKSKG